MRSTEKGWWRLMVEEPFDFQTGLLSYPWDWWRICCHKVPNWPNTSENRSRNAASKKEVREQLKREGVLRRDGDFWVL